MTTSVLSSAAIGSFIALGLLTATPGFTQGHAEEEAKLGSLMADGLLTVEPMLQTPLEDGRILSIVRVELAPGVTEPHHTHPGKEVLYGLGGSGVVNTSVRTVPIETGTVVHVEAGQAKALSNPSQSERLKVLAVLVLDPDEPALTVVGRQDGN